MRKISTIFSLLAVSSLAFFLSGCGGSSDSGVVPTGDVPARVRLVHVTDPLADTGLRLKLDNVDVLSNVGYGVSKTSTTLASTGTRNIDIVSENNSELDFGADRLELEPGITTFIPFSFQASGSFGMVRLQPNTMSLPAGQSGIRFLNLSQNSEANRMTVSLRFAERDTEPVATVSDISQSDKTVMVAPRKYRFAVTLPNGTIVSDQLGTLGADQRYTAVVYGGTSGQDYGMLLLSDQ